MSHARVCDHCGEVLITNSHGDSDDGESSAWLRVGTMDGQLGADACSRACAVELLADGSDLAEAIDVRLAGVAEVVRMVRGEADDDDE